MKKFFFIIFLVSFLASCQSSKDAFTLKKKSSADEFLVEKKSPLVLPPDYGKLPTPDSEQVDESEEDQDNIKNILVNSENLPTQNEKSSETMSLEKSILEKIK